MLDDRFQNEVAAHMDEAPLWSGVLLPVGVHAAGFSAGNNRITARITRASDPMYTVQQRMFIVQAGGVPMRNLCRLRLRVFVLCGLHEHWVVARARKHAAVAVVNVDRVGVVQVRVHLGGRREHALKTNSQRQLFGAAFHCFAPIK